MLHLSDKSYSSFGKFRRSWMFKHIVDAHLFSDTLLSLAAFCRTSGKQIVFPSCTFIDEDSYQSGYYICPHYNMKVKEVFKKKNTVWVLPKFVKTILTYFLILKYACNSHSNMPFNNNAVYCVM